MLSDPIALGMVPDEERGTLPFALVYGEPLIAAATFALEAADIEVLDPRTDWDYIVESGLPLVLHDSACPLTPANFLVDAVESAVASGKVVVGVRPLTDTLRVDLGDRLGETIDRTVVREVTSPIVIPAAVLARLRQMPSGHFVTVLRELAAYGLEELEAPALTRRIRQSDDIRIVEALGRPSRPEEELLGYP